MGTNDEASDSVGGSMATTEEQAEAPQKKESITGFGIAVWFALMGPILAFIPSYFGLPNAVGYLFLVLAALSLLVAVGGGLIELNEMGLLKGGSLLQNVAIAAVFGLFALGLHVAAMRVGALWAEMVLKVIVVLVSGIAAMFLATAAGDVVRDRVEKKGARGGAKVKPLIKIIAALLLWAATMTATILQTYSLWSDLSRP